MSYMLHIELGSCSIESPKSCLNYRTQHSSPCDLLCPRAQAMAPAHVPRYSLDISHPNPAELGFCAVRNLLQQLCVWDMRVGSVGP